MIDAIYLHSWWQFWVPHDTLSIDSKDTILQQRTFPSFPAHRAFGESQEVPNLWFIHKHFLHKMLSSWLNGRTRAVSDDTPTKQCLFQWNNNQLHLYTNAQFIKHFHIHFYLTFSSQQPCEVVEGTDTPILQMKKLRLIPNNRSKGTNWIGKF